MIDPDATIPEHLSDDEAAARYEQTDDFLNEAIDALTDVRVAAELPTDLSAALAAWYRTTETYWDAVRALRDEAARP